MNVTKTSARRGKRAQIRLEATSVEVRRNYRGVTDLYQNVVVLCLVVTGIVINSDDASGIDTGSAIGNIVVGTGGGRRRKRNADLVDAVSTRNRIDSQK